MWLCNATLPLPLTMQTPSTTTPDLSKLTVPQLKALCRERCITGYSKLSKAALLQKLSGTQSTSPLEAVKSKTSGPRTTVVSAAKGAGSIAQGSTPTAPSATAIESPSQASTTPVTKSAKRPAHTVDSVPKKRVKFKETIDKTSSAANHPTTGSPAVPVFIPNAPAQALVGAPRNLGGTFSPPTSPAHADIVRPHYGSTNTSGTRVVEEAVTRQPSTLRQRHSQHDPSTNLAVNSTVEECRQNTTPSDLTTDSCPPMARLSNSQPVSANGPLDPKTPAARDPTQRPGVAKRFHLLITSVHKSPVVTGKATITKSQVNTKIVPSPRTLTPKCFDVPPLASISLPPKTSDRKRVYRWAIILSMLPNEDRNTCCLVSRMFRYAVYLSAAHILSKKYPGHRLDVVSERYSQKMTNMWPYLRLRDNEVVYRRQAFKESFLGKFASSLSFDPLSGRLWSSPDDERQVEMALRFVLTRMWFAVSVGTYGHDSSMWTKGVVQNVTEVVRGEIWQVDVWSPTIMETFYVLEATCEVIGHPPHLGQFGPTPPNVLRTDWSSYISNRLSQDIVSNRSLLDSVTFSNSEDYHRGISKVWLQRASREGDMGVVQRHVAETYILACVVANGVSGRWMSANAMAQEFAGLPETGSSTTRSKVQLVNLYLPAHHHVESVHFTTSYGQDLHSALAIVQTPHREYYILRDNGMQVGCEEDDGVADIWMQILQCDSQGRTLQEAA